MLTYLTIYMIGWLLCRVKDLARLYGLCGRVLAHEALKASYKEYIKAAGLKIVKDEEKVRRSLAPRRALLV